MSLIDYLISSSEKVYLDDEARALAREDAAFVLRMRETGLAFMDPGLLISHGQARKEMDVAYCELARNPHMPGRGEAGALRLVLDELNERLYRVQGSRSGIDYRHVPT